MRCVGAASDVFLRTLQPGLGWETPRPPFEVQLHLEARAASTTGRPGEGQPYFSTSSGEPLACTLGAGQLPPGGLLPIARQCCLDAAAIVTADGRGAACILCSNGCPLNQGWW